MSELRVKGTITVISAIEEAGAGKKLTFRIDTGEQYNNLVEFEMYKGAIHIEHLDKFIQFNKVGDNVDVEFKLKTFNWKPDADNKIFTSLSAWRVDKVTAPTVAAYENYETKEEPNADALPF